MEILENGKDLAGLKFGRLTVLGDTGARTKNGVKLWRCLCDCGNVIIRRGDVLLYHPSERMSCGCIRKKNLTGQTFGKLTALEPYPTERGERSKWLCVCECGNTAVVETSRLLNGNTRSCGCLHKEHVRELIESNRGKPSEKLLDLTGMRFGRLVVLKKSPMRTKSNRVMWECRCDCGNIVTRSGDTLRYGQTRSCGCLAHEAHLKAGANLQRYRVSKAIDLTGQRFGRLTIIERGPNSPSGSARWRCKCDCGNETLSSAAALRSGHTRSCGCLGLEHATQAKIKHGETHERLYDVWAAMKRRCDNPNVDAYKYYGGKGIKVCDEWHDDYAKFKAWALAHGYAPELTIDRIDPDGNYEPSNCRWITFAENRARAHRKKK